jgi:hypothetical protein
MTLGSLSSRARRRMAAAALLASALSAGAQAQVAPAQDIESGATAIRCELRTIRAPEATQVMYFYVSDARRTVLETDGNPLGNVVQFSRQRIVVTRPPQQEGGLRAFVFDRLIGSLTVTAPAPVQVTGREPIWTLSGECQRIDASKPKF